MNMSTGPSPTRYDAERCRRVAAASLSGSIQSESVTSTRTQRVTSALMAQRRPYAGRASRMARTGRAADRNG